MENIVATKTFKCLIILTGDNFQSEADKNELNGAEILLADPGLVASLGFTQILPNLRWMQSIWAGTLSLLLLIKDGGPGV